jgi:hypothetical protein
MRPTEWSDEAETCLHQPHGPPLAKAEAGAESMIAVNVFRLAFAQ